MEMNKMAAAMFFLFLSWVPVFAEVKTQAVEYKDGGAVLEGYLAYDDSIQGKRPGILVIHEWNGLGHYAQSRAEKLAQLGYVAFAVDMYGKGVRPTTPEACGAEANKYKSNRGLMRQRVRAGLEVLKGNPWVDPKRLAAIGYCFGGGVALELARSGEPLAGFVSFHGNLDTPHPQDAKNIKGKVLVCQGGADSFTLSQVPDFEKEMKDAKVDYKLITYKGAVHGFTNPDNNGNFKGVQYDAKADKASWKAMKKLFAEIFKS
jgi:dienelactone hydrolase